MWRGCMRGQFPYRLITVSRGDGHLSARNVLRGTPSKGICPLEACQAESWRSFCKRVASL